MEKVGEKWKMLDNNRKSRRIRAKIGEK